MLCVSSRKRSSCCRAGELDEQQENNLRSRAFATKGSELCEAQAWLARHNMQGLMQQPMGPLPSAFWLAMAELNIALSAFQHTFEDLKLLEHHNFTRCGVHTAFEKLAFARGCHDALALQQQPHLQAVSLVLRSALAGCTEAAISQVTLLCPPFLAAWAERWLPATSCGGAAAAAAYDPPRLRLTAVQGYRPHTGPLRAATVYNLGLPTITSVPAACTMYIPSCQ